MKKKVILSILLLACILPMLNIVMASGMLSNIINQGTNWGNSGSPGGINDTITGFLKTDIIPAIGAIGNLIFAAVTVILGAKYVWSSAEGKASVLESLPTFVIAVVFFYLGEEVFNLFKDSSKRDLINATNWNAIANYVIYIINKVVQYATLGGIVFIGVKYLMASAEGKASVKTSFGGVVLGLLFACSATKIIEFIVTSADQII